MKDKPQINANERRLINRSNHESVHSCLGLLNNKPQINADERRFVNLNIQRSSEVYPEQSSALPVTKYEKAAALRFRTRMTRIGRIFTDIFDQCASRFNPPNNKPQRSQRTQSRIANLCALCVLCGGLTLFIAKAEKINSKGGTRMARMYTYPCASVSSVSSVFYFIPSSFCVHPRQILSMQEKTAAFYFALINKANTIFNPKSEINDRHLLLQRA